MTLPQAFIDRMKCDLKSEYAAFVSSYEKPPYYALRVNTLKITCEEFLKIAPFCTERVPWCDSGFYYGGGMGNHPASIAGLFYSQEPSAQLSAQMLDIRPGERVLDLCAAPGGKSTQAAAKLCGEGVLVANEVNTGRCKILRENTERMGIKNAVVTNMYPEKLENCFEGFFDKIIADAPCSGEGMFRKDPSAAAQWSIEHTYSCAARQEKILKSAFKMLRGGGRLVYSTCTFSKEENENVCEKILDTVSGIKLVKAQRLMPHKIKGEGHFAALFEKTHGGERQRVGAAAVDKAAVAAYRAFESENMTVHLKGSFASFGDTLYLLPTDFGTLDGVRCMSAGLCLGESRRGRFVPSHALCMALKKEEFARTISLSDEELARYTRGEEIPTASEKGYGAMLYNGKFPVGWYKSVGETAKNHYPKYLRGR